MLAALQYGTPAIPHSGCEGRGGNLNTSRTGETVSRRATPRLGEPGSPSRRGATLARDPISLRGRASGIPAEHPRSHEPCAGRGTAVRAGAEKGGGGAVGPSPSPKAGREGVGRRFAAGDPRRCADAGRRL